jgi:AMMECR1 domain-containing protein
MGELAARQPLVLAFQALESADRLTREFLRHLKLKAGMPPDYWSDDIRVYRYTTESFSTD